MIQGTPTAMKVGDFQKKKPDQMIRLFIYIKKKLLIVNSSQRLVKDLTCI